MLSCYGVGRQRLPPDGGNLSPRGEGFCVPFTAGNYALLLFLYLIQQGVEREYRNVYLAVSEEEIVGEEIPMLLPPALLQETNKARRKKEKIKEPDDPARHNVADRSKYGLKDSNTGKNAV